jgi:hypothetical protein
MRGRESSIMEIQLGKMARSVVNFGFGGSNPVIATSPGEGARVSNLQTKGEKIKNKKGQKKVKNGIEPAP